MKRILLNTLAAVLLILAAALLGNSPVSPSAAHAADPKASPTPEPCPATRCFRDLRGVCWCKASAR